MARISRNIQDFGLNRILERRLISGDVVLHICSAEPIDYTAAVTTSLGNKIDPTISPITDAPGGGRQVTVSAISDGVGTSSGTASHWALVSIAQAELLGTQSLAGNVQVTSTGTFTLTSFSIIIPNPA